MTDFLQLHLLTTYPPSNPNRDDLGRPKTAIIGGRMRQRISSQAIKRALRTSEAFETALVGHKGERTQRLGEEVLEHLRGKGVGEDQARCIARGIAEAFGKLEEKQAEADKKGRAKDKPDSVRIRQLAFISPDEKRLAFDLAVKAAAGASLPKEKDLAKELLRVADGAVDIAMFGRMLADNPDFNREAAVQVAHAFTTNAVEIEDDYYTAVDDLKKPTEDAGAGFVGEAGFGAGVYYLYVCVNRDLLVKNLDGDRTLAARGLGALVSALATASPTGKRNSFANHVRAEFMLGEKGDAQPRSLASAFTTPIEVGDQLETSIARLMTKRAAFTEAYGKDWREELALHVGAPGGATLADVAAFAAAGLGETP
jgi:CRISPR system Cascade subunit CasC